MTVKILKLLHRVFQWETKELPSYNSIANWVQKSGYHYNSVGEEVVKIVSQIE
jgi:hypothetical protein